MMRRVRVGVRVRGPISQTIVEIEIEIEIGIGVEEIEEIEDIEDIRGSGSIPDPFATSAPQQYGCTSRFLVSKSHPAPFRYRYRYRPRACFAIGLWG
ncbi:MAG: hypothetical protein ACOX52_18540 [Verrucomicrobiota bacterium]